MLMLATSQGVHKVAYGLDQRDGINLNLELDSPFLEDKISSELHLNSKRVGAAYEVNRVRREVGLEYDVDDTSAKVTLKTPFDQYKRLSVRSAMSSEDQFEFGFEADLDQHEAAFGIMYDFTKITDMEGNVLFKFAFDNQGGEMGLTLQKGGDLPYTFDSILYYKDAKSQKNDYELKTTFAKQGNWLELTMDGRKGDAPELNWLIRVNQATMSEIEAVLELRGAKYQAKATRNGEENVVLTVATPMPGYESIKLTYQKTAGERREMLVTKNGKEVMNI